MTKFDPVKWMRQVERDRRRAVRAGALQAIALELKEATPNSESDLSGDHKTRPAAEATSAGGRRPDLREAGAALRRSVADDPTMLWVRGRLRQAGE